VTAIGGLQRRGTDLGLLFLRVSVGCTMLFAHGLGKVGRLAETPVEFADPLGLGATVSLLLAIGGEVVGSALIVVGAWTRLAAVPLLTTMLVAFFVVHADDPFGRKELALVYAFSVVTILLAGPGRHSVDGWIARRG
jgi:putative oxidoreductase